nr:hypothetical protein [Tanacetum cinerariifolium]
MVQELGEDEIVHKALGDRLVKAATTASSLEAEHDSGGGPRCQETIGDTIAQTRFERVSKQSNDSLLASDKDHSKEEIASQRDEIASLKRRVKKLEKRNKSRTHGLKRLYKIHNKDAKKTKKMSYPRFTKIIIDYSMLKDQSILRRNKMFWRTARDDTMFNSMRYISRPEKTRVYGAILPKELTNQAMLESKAYKTYYAFPSGEKTSKPKYVRKKADFITSPKQKSVQGTKGTRLKTKAKVAKSDKKKQPAKKPKADGLAVLSKVMELTLSQSDDNDESDGERTKSDRDEIPDPNKTNEEHDEEEEEEYDDEFNIEEDEKMDEEEDDEVTKELYKDVNSGFEQEEEDAHVALTPVLDTQKLETTTSLPTLLDFAFVFKFNERVTNLEKDLSEMKQVDQYAKTLSSIPAIVDRYLDNKLGEAINKAIQAHNFNCREEAQAKKKEYIELVDSTVRKIIKEEVNTRLSQILPQAISDVATPVIEKNVTESLEAAVLTRSSSQPQSSYEAAATLFEFKLTKILIDKMEKNKSFDIADYKRELYDALIKSYNTKKDIFESYGEVFSLKRSRDDKDKDQDPFVG